MGLELALNKEIAKVAVYIERKLGKKMLTVEETMEETLLSKSCVYKYIRTIDKVRYSSWDVAEWIVKCNRGILEAS